MSWLIFLYILPGRGSLREKYVTLEYLQEHWKEYAIEVDADFPEMEKRVQGKISLKEQFFVCFIDQKEQALYFDPGGHNPKCLVIRSDEQENCHMKFPSGRWVKIGKFVRL